MKRLSKFALLPGLILLTWVFVIYSRKPGQKMVVPAPSAESSSALPPATVSVSATFHDDPMLGLTAKPSEALPPPESSWAKELRELKELAVKDPDAALARVADLPDKHERKSAAAAVCVIVAAQDAAKAMAAAWSSDLGKFTDESEENNALETLARRWAEADLAKALVWASTLPADDEARRDRVVKGIALAVAQVAPAEAARMVAKYINPESSMQIDAAIAVLREWAAREYAGAVAWVALFPAGPLRERGIEELAGLGAAEPPTQNPPN